jgi:hypothetical protein
VSAGLRVAALLLLALTTNQAHAVFKCTDPKTGKVTYSDARCPAAADQVGVRIMANVVDAHPIPEAGLRAGPLRGSRVEELIMAGRVAIGMTEQEVFNSWGDPSHVNTDIYGDRMQKQMVFNRGADGTQYVYTENGLVTAIQSRPGYVRTHTERCYSALDIRNAGVGENSQSKTAAEKQAIRDRVARMKPC